jgi:hypothetical protein
MVQETAMKGKIDFWIPEDLRALFSKKSKENSCVSSKLMRQWIQNFNETGEPGKTPDEPRRIYIHKKTPLDPVMLESQRVKINFRIAESLKDEFQERIDKLCLDRSKLMVKWITNFIVNGDPGRADE